VSRERRGGPYAIPGRRPVAEALRAGRGLQEVVVAGERGDLGELAGAARQQKVRVRTAGPGELDALAEGVVHQGVVALGDPPRHLPLRDLAASGDLLVMLDGITDPHNLGAIARTAEVAGAAGLILPKRRAAHVTPAAEKAAAGAFSWLAVSVVPNLVRALELLAEAGFWSVGLAGGAADDLWTSNLLDGRVVLVVGAEGPGLSRLVGERVDGRVAIPMAGHLDSLNASVASAVALFEVLRRRRGTGERSAPTG
jgi:23S rRNA (guanosine2251-2'-O)-methyltransferase